MVKMIAIGVVAFLLGTILLGFGINTLFSCVVPSLLGFYDGSMYDPLLLFQLNTFIYGAGACALIVLLYLLFHKPSAKKAKRLMKNTVENFESNLENSRFMTEKEKEYCLKAQARKLLNWYEYPSKSYNYYIKVVTLK